MASRQEVYTAIDSERDYQDKMAGNSAREHIDDNRDQGSLITLMDYYLSKVKEAHAGPQSLGSPTVTSAVRKVVALGVMLMERNGAPLRT